MMSDSLKVTKENITERFTTPVPNVARDLFTTHSWPDTRLMVTVPEGYVFVQHIVSFI